MNKLTTLNTMENVASNNTRAAIKNCPVFAGRNKDTFGEYKSKVRVCLSLYSKPVFEVFQGMTQPSSRLGTADTEALDIAAERRWQQANHDLWSILFLTTSGSANNVVKKFEGKRPEDGTGNGQAAWNALNEKYNSHTKEARRACHEKLVNTKMEPGQDPDDFFFILDKCRDRLEEMGQTMHDERYEDIILQALPAEYERVRIASYEKRDFGLDDIRHMVHTMYVDNLSRPVNHKPVAGRGIAMQATGHKISDVRCNYCKGVGHLKRDCATLKAKEHRQQHNQWEQHTQSQPSKCTTYHVETKGNGKQQWCSFHKSTTNSDADCRVQHRDKTNEAHANCACHSCYPAVLSSRNLPQGCCLERTCISFTAMEAATEEEFWPFGPTDERDASFGHSASVNEPRVNSGLFGAIGGVTGEETSDSVLLAEEDPVQKQGLRDRITGGLMAIVRGLMMVAVIHYLWLLFGSLVSARESLTTSNDQTELFGGITNAEDGSTLKVGPVVGAWNRHSNDAVNVVVDSGASGHYFDDTIIPGLRDNLDNYQLLDVPRKITTAGKGHLYGVAQGILRGRVIDDKGQRRLVQLSCLIVPGLGRNLFSVKQAARNGIVSIFDMDSPRLEANNFTLPLQELGSDLYSFSLDFTNATGAELAMQTTADATLWHRRLGHLNRKSLNVLKKCDNNGVSFDGTVADCDVCAVGKSQQLAHPKTADHKVKHPFQLVFADLMGPITPEALGGYKYVSKNSDECTKWTEIHLLKSKHDALIAFQSFIKSAVLPIGFRVERLRTDKGGEYTSDKFRDYCLQTGVSLEYASTNTPQQIGMSERVGRTLAAMVRWMLVDSGLPKFLWGELMFTAAFLGNRAPHAAIDMQSPYKMLNGTEPDLRRLRVIGARAFVHIETHTKKTRTQGS